MPTRPFVDVHKHMGARTYCNLHYVVVVVCIYVCVCISVSVCVRVRGVCVLQSHLLESKRNVGQILLASLDSK